MYLVVHDFFIKLHAGKYELNIFHGGKKYAIGRYINRTYGWTGHYRTPSQLGLYYNYIIYIELYNFNKIFHLYIKNKLVRIQNNI